MRIVAVASIIAAVLLTIILGFYFLPSGQSGLPAKTATGTGSTDLGINYLPLTPGVSAYYDLGVDSGALVTAVIPSGPADRAGIKVGDVILSLNGVRVETDTPLLGIMRSCPAGSDLTLECCRDKTGRTVTLVSEAY